MIIIHTMMHISCFILKNANKNVGTVWCIWRDDEGNMSQYDLPGCRYYPKSPVCILSQKKLGISLNDWYFGDIIESGIRTYIFNWDNQIFHRTINNTTSYIPKIVINDDFSPLAFFFSAYRNFFNDYAGYSLFTNNQL